ncbi:MAG: response regulator [Labilithrix sp.]|nr:response regulator [Labilithrix sp.]MCW5831309.1 response regulator [Labilithrix sp.]
MKSGGVLEVPLALILLVEDNEDDAALALRAFRKHEPNREIHVAADGVLALEFLHGKAGAAPTAPLPRFVLLDLKLPKLDGFQVLERIRQEPRTSNLPVVMLTSSAEQTDIERSYALGANSYVRKPISFGDFLDAARQLDDYWSSLNLTASRS